MVSKFGVHVEDLPEPVRRALLSRQDYLVHYQLIEAREPDPGCGVDEAGLDDRLVDVLIRSGITRLYSFQVEAIKKIRSGEDVVLVAPPGSGKTEAFALPVLQMVLGEEGKGVKALFIYPTKALGRDQLPKLRRMADALDLKVMVFDGDTPAAERRRILDSPPELIITNFDTIHHHLMHRTGFGRLLGDVNHIVVDEVHVYRGTFGSNVHFIVKRLERLAKKFQVIAASATIGNPQEFCELLFGRSFSVVSGGEGRHGKIHFAMLFPTLRSHRSLIVDLLKSLVAHGYRPIVFSDSHLGAELTAFYARRGGVDVEVHRAGLLPSHRKRVEDSFKAGLLKAISATPTLELGIDIGSVDAVVSDLVPVTRLIQRRGRAARRGQEGLAFLVLRERDPISQYYRNNPHHYFEDVEPGYVDPKNPEIAKVHILAAALDRPLMKGEFLEYQREIEDLVKKGLLIEQRDRLTASYREALKLLREHDIRGSGERVIIRLGGKKLGERALPQAIKELHPGAVDFLAGSRFRSLNLVFCEGGGVAEVERLPDSHPYYTKPLLQGWATILEKLESKRAFGVEVLRCELLVEKSVTGYVKLELGKDVTKGEKVLLEEPVSYSFRTKGFVFKAPLPQAPIRGLEEGLMDYVAASSYHATEHVLIEGSNMLTGGAARDMGGIALGSSGLIFVYDGSLGGNGATKALFDRIEDAFRRGLKVLEVCPCTSESGCPRCTYSYDCGNNNEFLHKEGAKEILRTIVFGARVDLVEPLAGERTII
ncbi:MAG: DEAD/DEAH box helicase [Nitrososphaerota archaeon]